VAQRYRRVPVRSDHGRGPSDFSRSERPGSVNTPSGK
jgi:hypothetical protein